MNVVKSVAIVAGIVMFSMLLSRLWTSQTLVGVPAPELAAQTSEGDSETLDSLLETGPVALYFIKEDCPINADALPYFKQVAEAYEEATGAQFVGVFDGDAERFQPWSGENGVEFPVLYDPDHEIIQSYGVKRSPWVIGVGDNARVDLEHRGYSGESLQELNTYMARAAKVEEVDLDFDGAPRSMVYGCPF